MTVKGSSGRRIIFLAAGLLLTGSSVQWTQGAPTEVFINEFHYDNLGTDVGEAIEIAGPAGTDLTGWSLVLYNGATQLLYTTTLLTGTIPDQQNGYGTVYVTYVTNGVQNGSPDGFALIDPLNNVVQFLSYEGVFTALDGPAVGMTSDDIGVVEPNDTPIGSSLQLAGIGKLYEDFAWMPPNLETLGAVNKGQHFGSIEVFINEFHYDNLGTDVGEAIEIAGPAGTDLTGWSLVLYNGATQLLYTTTLLTGTIPDQQNGYGTVYVTYATNGVQNGSPDGFALIDPLNNVVQFLSYEGAFTALDGPAVGMISDDIGVVEPNDTPIGSSLQLVGVGRTYGDFTWVGPIPNTFGNINDGQLFIGLETSFNLVAGGGNPTSAMDVGDIQVWNDVSGLYVRFLSDEPWCLMETHLHVSASLEGIPQKNGNPIPGRFEDKDPHDCVTDVTYQLEPGWPAGTELYIAAHAEVQRLIGSEGASLDGPADALLDPVPIFVYESAWGEGEDFPGKNWAMYLNYTVATSSQED
jgi:hypothetical protein